MKGNDRLELKELNLCWGDQLRIYLISVRFYIERFYFTGLMLKIEANIKVEMVEIYKVRGVLNFDYS